MACLFLDTDGVLKTPSLLQHHPMNDEDLTSSILGIAASSVCIKTFFSSKSAFPSAQGFPSAALGPYGRFSQCVGRSSHVRCTVIGNHSGRDAPSVPRPTEWRWQSPIAALPVRTRRECMVPPSPTVPPFIAVGKEPAAEDNRA